MSRRLAWLLCALVLDVGAEPSSERGEYVFRATGGCSCHTAAGGQSMAGGRPMATPFGTIYSTNITPDADTGIGAWSDDDFVRAMTEGVGPAGEHYFPAFPYTSFTRMTRDDLLDLKAYLFDLPAVRSTTPEPDMPPPFRWRFTLPLWKALNFTPGPFEPEPDSSAAWNRGAYIVTALAHCGECHTPRNAMGGLRQDRAYAGAVDGPEGESSPNITSHPDAGIGRWSTADLTWYLTMGLEPDGDSAQGVMMEVIDQGYQHLSAEDLKAIAAFVQSLPPIE